MHSSKQCPSWPRRLVHRQWQLLLATCLL
jgi:hypothetical protein